MVEEVSKKISLQIQEVPWTDTTIPKLTNQQAQTFGFNQGLRKALDIISKL